MLIVDHPWLFYSLLPLVAILYASVGHGGASGYLALMALFGVQSSFMKPTALLLNLFVAGISFLYFWRNKYFKWKIFYPFALTSIPAAFVGGYLEIDPFWYKKILGLLLIFSIVRLLSSKSVSEEGKKKNSIALSLAIGAAIGFFSGLIGIGGGIILSPVILLLHWADMKEAAAVSALFIWINSLAGLTGMMISGASIPLMAFALLALALIGGWIGGYLGSKKMNLSGLKKALAVVLAMASVKLLLT